MDEQSDSETQPEASAVAPDVGVDASDAPPDDDSALTTDQESERDDLPVKTGQEDA